MLSIPARTDITINVLVSALTDTGFSAIDVRVEGDQWIVDGVNPNREDEWGGHAILDEVDRPNVEEAIEAAIENDNDEKRVIELSRRTTLTGPEQDEAILLLLKLTVEDKA